MRNPARLAPVSLLALAVLAVLSPAAAADGPACSTCHTGSNPSGGYQLKLPALSASYPSAVPPGTTFNFSLTVSHPGKFNLKQATVTVTVEGGPAPPGGLNLTWRVPDPGESGGTRTNTWSITVGNTTGRLSVNATLRFNARYRHSSSGDNDVNPYMLRSYSHVSVRPMALYTTATELSVRAVSGRAATFDLVSYSDIRNLSLVASDNLAGTVLLAPGSIGGLAPGQRHTVQVVVAGSPGRLENGRIDLLWEDKDGTVHSGFVLVRLVGPSEPQPEGPVRWTGRFTGLFSLGLLAASVALGSIRKGGRRRVRVHCAVSWFILGLGVYHGLMLVILPYSRVWLSGWVLLGYAGAAAMGASSVIGLLRKRIARRAGHRAWLWLHRATLAAAIVLVVVHALMLGTDFRFAHLPLRGGG